MSARQQIYQTFHPSDNGLIAERRVAKKSEYYEHLLDGLHVFYNPFAEYPLTPDILGHERIAQFIPDGMKLVTIAPDDFLLMRMIRTVRSQ
ncbi:hypothetical protein QN395_20980 [Undibacterium sp. RTI2.2]|nr:hypothetical protein [Undibacterium sp. RTI2.2]